MVIFPPGLDHSQLSIFPRCSTVSDLQVSNNAAVAAAFDAVTIAERTVKVCLLHFRLEYHRKCVTDRIYFQVGVIWLNAFTDSKDGGS